MAVTAAQLGRHSRRVVSSRGTSGRPAGKQIRAVRRNERFPYCSFDGYYNFICAHHVQPATNGSFDGAWIGAQLLDLHS